MEAIHDSAVERRRDNLIYARSGTAWPYCLSMSAALPENMRGFDLSAMVLLVSLNCFARADGQGACCARVVVYALLTRRRCCELLLEERAATKPEVLHAVGNRRNACALFSQF